MLLCLHQDLVPSGSSIQEGDGFATLYVLPRPDNSGLLDPDSDPSGTVSQFASNAALVVGESFDDLCSGFTVTVDSLEGPSETDPLPKLIVDVTQNASGCAFYDATVSFPSLSPGHIISLPAASWTEIEVRVDDASPDDSDVTVTLGYFQSVDNPFVQLGASKVLGSGGVPKTVSFTGAEANLHVLPSGPQTLIARAVDSPEGCCTVTSEASINVGVRPPAFQSPPVVTLPSPGSQISSFPFMVQATATDEDGIASIAYWFDPDYEDICGVGEAHHGMHPPSCDYHEFFPAYSRNFPEGATDKGAFLIGATPTAPYSWDVESLPPGTYSVWAQAHDVLGNSSTSTPVSLTVDGEGAFTVDIPIDAGAQVPSGGTRTIVADVTADAGEVGYVDFFIDGELLSRDEDSPFSAVWQVPPAGGVEYTLRADAFGIGGRTASDSVGVVSSP